MAKIPTASLRIIAEPEAEWVPLYVAPLFAAPTDVRDTSIDTLNHLIAKACAPYTKTETFRCNWPSGVLELDTWLDYGGGQFKDWELTFHPLEYVRYKNLLFGPRGDQSDKYSEFRETQIDSFWSLNCERLIARLRSGDVKAVARAGIALAEKFSLIPGDVWHHFVIEDWRKGVAITAAGERLYSVYVLPGKGSGPATRVDRLLNRVRKRAPTAQQIAFQVFMAVRHPNGKPAGTPFDTLAAKFGEWVKREPEAHAQNWPVTITGRGIAKILSRRNGTERSER